MTELPKSRVGPGPLAREHADEDGAVADYLAAIVDCSDDAILSKDLHGRITSWNKGAERLFGYASTEAVGKPITLLIPPDRLHEEPAIVERIARGERIDHYETARQRKDGSLVEISLTASPVRNGKGQIVGISKIARDITGRKRREAQLATLAREAEHRAKDVLSVVQACVQLSRADTPEELKRVIAGRVQALASLVSLFAETRWAGAELRTLVTEELSPYCLHGAALRRLDGPKLMLEPERGSGHCHHPARVGDQCRQVRSPVGVRWPRRRRVVENRGRPNCAALDRNRRPGRCAAGAGRFRHPTDERHDSPPTGRRNPLRLARRGACVRNHLFAPRATAAAMRGSIRGHALMLACGVGMLDAAASIRPPALRKPLPRSIFR